MRHLSTWQLEFSQICALRGGILRRRLQLIFSRGYSCAQTVLCLRHQLAQLLLKLLEGLPYSCSASLQNRFRTRFATSLGRELRFSIALGVSLMLVKDPLELILRFSQEALHKNSHLLMYDSEDCVHDLRH